jgi:hypothetical protein
MAPALEAEPIKFGEKHLKRHGWKVGKHCAQEPLT